MAGDGVSTRLQKEVGGMQQEISKIHEEMAHLETKMENRLKEFKEEFWGDLQTLLSQYFGPPPKSPPVAGTVEKGKGVLGAPPTFPLKDSVPPQVQTGPSFAEGGSVHLSEQQVVSGASGKCNQLECPKFNGSSFRGWWTKLEQFFEADGTLDNNKVRLVMLNLEGRALEWHHFYSQRNGGLHMLSWPAYLKSLQDRFGFGQFGNSMRELVHLKQLGTMEQYQDLFVGVLNQLHLPETYVLSIFISSLKPEIGHYLDLFEPSTLLEAFQLARKIEVLISYSGKGLTVMGAGTPKSLSATTIASRYSSSPIRIVSSVQSVNNMPPTRSGSGVQSVNNMPPNRSGFKTISPALMAERKQKGLCFWCAAKYHVGHKYMKSQLYQFLLEPSSDSEAEEFQECPEKLNENVTEGEDSKAPVISLHALIGLQGHNTMRVAARLGLCWAIILVDSGSTHNFINSKFVNRLSIPLISQE